MTHPPHDPACPGRLHGSKYAVRTAGCRCPEAVAAVRDYERAYSRNRVASAYGTHAAWPRHRGVNPYAVDLVVTCGLREPLGPDERRAAILTLKRLGLSDAETARRVGCAQRTVARHTAANREGRQPYQHRSAS